MFSVVVQDSTNAAESQHRTRESHRAVAPIRKEKSVRASTGGPSLTSSQNTKFNFDDDTSDDDLEAEMELGFDATSARQRLGHRATAYNQFADYTLDLDRLTQKVCMRCLSKSCKCSC